MSDGRYQLVWWNYICRLFFHCGVWWWSVFPAKQDEPALRTGVNTNFLCQQTWLDAPSQGWWCDDKMMMIPWKYVLLATIQMMTMLTTMTERKCPQAYPLKAVIYPSISAHPDGPWVRSDDNDDHVDNHYDSNNDDNDNNNVNNDDGWEADAS